MLLVISKERERRHMVHEMGEVQATECFQGTFPDRTNWFI